VGKVLEVQLEVLLVELELVEQEQVLELALVGSQMVS
jgi:hypothetical protein